MKLRFMTMLILVLNLSSANAELRDVVLSTKNPAMKFFELKKACLLMGHSHTLLAAPSGISRLDCMGKKVSVTEFCRTQFPNDPRLLRGLISPDKLVACHFAESAILTVDCSRFPSFCKSAEIGCKSLKPHYGVNHELAHASLTVRDEGRFLQCFFSEKDFNPEL